jgi:xanthine dehydrogenase molybdenum-binding subunit
VIGVAAQIAAEELGVDHTRVSVLLADTALTPDGGATTASRQTFVTGNAVRLAAAQVRQLLISAVAGKLQVTSDSIRLQGGQVIVDGKRIPLNEAIGMAVAAGSTLAARMVYTAPPTVRLGEPGDAHIAFSFATQAVQVEVNTESGEVKVLRVVAAHDIGRVINPLSLSGQIEGGVMMGLSLALFEEFRQVGGYPQATSLAKYRLAKASDKPQITILFVENPVSTGPYGAKGVGEITLIPTAAAIANAIYNATGGRVYSLPATPQRVLEAFHR